MNDYRWPKDRKKLRAFFEAGGHDNDSFVRWAPPDDRKGLIAAVHALYIVDVRAFKAFSDNAKRIAKKTKQRVYYVMTVSRWHLLQFGLNAADDEEDYDRPKGPGR